MGTHDTINLKLAMEEPWYKELLTFLMVPALATIACCFIPFFRGEQEMNFMAMLPLAAVFSYGHTLSPRKPYYEKSWKKVMAYHEFVLANMKRVFLFAAPAGLLAWAISAFLIERSKELAMFFETAIWGLAAGIFVCGLVYYVEETVKLRKTDQKTYRANVKHLWKWVIPPTIAFGLLAFSKIYMIFELLGERS